MKEGWTTFGAGHIPRQLAGREDVRFQLMLVVQRTMRSHWQTIRKNESAAPDHWTRERLLDDLVDTLSRYEIWQPEKVIPIGHKQPTSDLK